MSRLILRTSIAQAEPITALDWDGTAPGRRAIAFVAGLSVAPPPAYPMTYLWKSYFRDQVTTRADGTRYSTTFFHGNYGLFDWGAGYIHSYYGCHPYPSPPPDGDGKFELSADAVDYTARGTNQFTGPSDPFFTFGRWYAQGLVVEDVGGELRRKFYVDLPATSSADFIEQNITATYTAPPSPCIIFGQAPDDGLGQSWGHYDGWEEGNQRDRGIQIYSGKLTEAQMVALSAFDSDADVKAYWAANSITSDWYLNMNPRTDKIADQRDSTQHNPTLVSTNGAAPADWTG